MVEPLRHRQTKEAANGYVQPTATASHLDSTIHVALVASVNRPHVRFASESDRIAAQQRNDAQCASADMSTDTVLCGDPIRNSGDALVVGIIGRVDKCLIGFDFVQ